MRYPKMMDILDENPTYGIRVYVGRILIEVPREQFLEAIKAKRGTRFNVEVEIDHGSNEIAIFEKTE